MIMDTLIDDGRNGKAVGRQTAKPRLQYTKDAKMYDRLYAPTIDECLERAMQVETIEDISPLVQQLYEGSLDVLYGRESEKCETLKKLIEAKLQEITWENIHKAITVVQTAKVKQLQEIRTRYAEHWILNRRDSNEVSLYTKEQIDLLFQAIKAKEETLGIGTAPSLQ